MSSAYAKIPLHATKDRFNVELTSTVKCLPFIA